MNLAYVEHVWLAHPERKPGGISVPIQSSAPIPERCCISHLPGLGALVLDFGEADADMVVAKPPACSIRGQNSAASTGTCAEQTSGMWMCPCSVLCVTTTYTVG